MNRIVAEDVAAIAADPVVAGAAAALAGRTVLIAGAGGLIARYTAFALAELSAASGLGLEVVCLVRDLDKAERTYAAHAPAAAITLTRHSGGGAGPATSAPRQRATIMLAQQTLGEPLRYDGPADVVIHAGGSSSPRFFDSDPYGVAAANVRAAFDLVDLARHRGARRIVGFSSREVYGMARPDSHTTAEVRPEVGVSEPRAADPSRLAPAGGPQGSALPTPPGPSASPLTEETVGIFDHLAPRNAYPEAKRMTETVLAAASAQFGLGFQALRLASVYGPGMRLADDGRAMADLIAARLAGRDLVLASDGSTVRAYCYVADAVRGVLTALLAGADNTVYNIANETEPISIRDLAGLLASLPAPRRNPEPGQDSPPPSRTAPLPPFPQSGADAPSLFSPSPPPLPSSSDPLSPSPQTGADSPPSLSPLPPSRPLTPRVVLGPAGTPPGYSTFGYTPVSTARLEALGWRPQVTLREGLVRTLESFGDED